MRQCILLLCSLAVLVGCAGVPTSQTSPTPTLKPAPAALDKPTYTVQRGEVVDRLQLSGRVAAVQQQDLSFTQEGHLKTLYVDRTSVITAGQVLAELDLGDLPNQLRQAQVSLEQAQLARDRDNERRRFAERRAQLDLDEAHARLAALQAPPRPEELAKVQAAVQDAQAGLDQTRSSASAAKTNAELRLRQAAGELVVVQEDYAKAALNWEKVKDNINDVLYDVYKDQFLKAELTLHNAEAAVAQAQVDFDTARQNEGPAIRQAEAALAVAQAQLAALNEGPRRADLADARRAVERATLALEEARQGADPELEKRVASAQLDIERIQAQIDAGQIRAPFDGKIAEIDVRPGDPVEAYKAVISVMNASELEVIVDYFGDEDASKIGVGQAAEINFVRYKGRAVEGRVARLPSKLTTSGSTVNPDTFFHLNYDAQGLELDVGDLAQVVLTLSHKADALWLPPQAVRAFEGRRFVVVKDGERQRRQDIKVGIISADRVEIVGGLKEGDVVVGQ